MNQIVETSAYEGGAPPSGAMGRMSMSHHRHRHSKSKKLASAAAGNTQGGGLRGSGRRNSRAARTGSTGSAVGGTFELGDVSDIYQSIESIPTPGATTETDLQRMPSMLNPMVDPMSSSSTPSSPARSSPTLTSSSTSSAVATDDTDEGAFATGIPGWISGHSSVQKRHAQGILATRDVINVNI